MNSRYLPSCRSSSTTSSTGRVRKRWWKNDVIEQKLHVFGQPRVACTVWMGA